MTYHSFLFQKMFKKIIFWFLKILIWDVYGSRLLRVLVRVRVWKKFSIIYTLYIFLESSQRAEHIGKIRNHLSFLFRKIFKKIIFWFFKMNELNTFLRSEIAPKFILKRFRFLCFLLTIQILFKRFNKCF